MICNKLEKRIIDISYKNKTSHIGSCLNCVNIIDKIYMVKKPEDIFILSNGHAFLAWAVVLEKYLGVDAEKLIEKHGTHPDRDVENGILVSTGSLGQGLPIAVGMALASQTRDVYVLTSDGELAEGSCWEALRIAAENRLENLKVTVTANGMGAYSHVDADWLDMRLNTFYPTLLVKTNMLRWPDFMNGLSGHYIVLDEEKYNRLITP